MGSLGPTPTTPTRRKVSARDIANIRSLLAGTSAVVLAPFDEGYAETLKRWSRAADKPAGVSVLPSTAHEIATVVRYATENGLEIAVKGGGHSTAGASSTNGGVLFDLAKMINVDVDVGRKVFKVQGGANWGHVDRAGYPHSVGTVGGTVADTGVGGLTLGGGYGWLSGQHGLTADCLLECTVVLANGDVVVANRTTNPDLLWALGGAGHNFGIVTEFVLQAFDVPREVWGGVLMFPPSDQIIENVTQAINSVYDVGSDGTRKARGLGCGVLGFVKPPSAGGETRLLVGIIYFGTEKEGKEVYKDLLDLQPAVSTMAMVPYPDINTMLAPPYGQRASLKGAAYDLPLRAGFVSQIFEAYQSFTEANEDAHLSMVLWELYDPTKVASLESGCFGNRGTHFNTLICAMWTRAENDERCREWPRLIDQLFVAELEREDGSRANSTSEKKTTSSRAAYGNYDHYAASKAIFGKNYSKLQRLKAKYDGANVFNKLFAIAPEEEG